MKVKAAAIERVLDRTVVSESLPGTALLVGASAVSSCGAAYSIREVLIINIPLLLHHETARLHSLFGLWRVRIGGDNVSALLLVKNSTQINFGF